MSRCCDAASFYLTLGCILNTFFSILDWKEFFFGHERWVWCRDNFYRTFDRLKMCWYRWPWNVCIFDYESVSAGPVSKKIRRWISMIASRFRMVLTPKESTLEETHFKSTKVESIWVCFEKIISFRTLWSTTTLLDLDNHLLHFTISRWRLRKIPLLPPPTSLTVFFTRS